MGGGWVEAILAVEDQHCRLLVSGRGRMGAVIVAGAGSEPDDRSPLPWPGR